MSQVKETKNDDDPSHGRLCHLPIATLSTLSFNPTHELRIGGINSSTIIQGHIVIKKNENN